MLVLSLVSLAICCHYSISVVFPEASQGTQKAINALLLLAAVLTRGMTARVLLLRYPGEVVASKLFLKLS